MASALRVIFMGTPDFVVAALSEIVAVGHDVLAVYSQPPRPAGRGMAARKSPVHSFAEEAGIRLALHPDDPDDVPIGGVARIFSTFEGFERASAAIDSPAWGLLFCIGTLLSIWTSQIWLPTVQANMIKASGRVSGTIRYGQIEIECGGQISGDVQAQPAPEHVDVLADVANVRVAS